MVTEDPPADRQMCGICTHKLAQTKKAKPKNKKRRGGKGGIYQSWEWKKLRFEVLKHYGPKCMLCGSEHHIVVDHIKPVRAHPELALDFDNLQVLCNDCNMGKSYDDETDFRPRD
jgi:5-methylcytosine-specific restriction endonuclease McrA